MLSTYLMVLLRVAQPIGHFWRLYLDCVVYVYLMFRDMIQDPVLLKMLASFLRQLLPITPAVCTLPCHQLFTIPQDDHGKLTTGGYGPYAALGFHRFRQ